MKLKEIFSFLFSFVCLFCIMLVIHCSVSKIRIILDKLTNLVNFPSG